jgi:hypothetical protein
MPPTVQTIDKLPACEVSEEIHTPLDNAVMERVPMPEVTAKFSERLKSLLTLIAKQGGALRGNRDCARRRALAAIDATRLPRVSR